MKILLQHTNYYPTLGGIETYIENLSKIFLERGHQVYVLCFMPKNYKKTQEIYHGVRIIRCPSPNIPKNKLSFWPAYSEKTLTKFLRTFNEKFDLILCRYPVFLRGDLMKFDRKKVIYIAPSVAKIYNKRASRLYPSKVRGALKISGEILYQMEKYALPKIKTITLSRAVKEQILKLYKLKSEYVNVIAPGVNIKQYRVNKGKHHKRTGVICVSRLEPGKNQRALIRVFEMVKSDENLVFVGGGEDNEKLRKLAEKSKKKQNIVFTGPSRKVSQFLARAKILVFPTIYEGFGHVLLEAMASGIPCIAFMADGKKIITASNEIIKNNRTGFLVKDEAEMAEKIDLLLKNEKLRKKMGNAARKEAERYSWEKCADKILEFASKKLF